MINRFTLIAVTTAFALTGCAKITAATSAATSAAASALTPAKPQATDFSTGPTVVTVTHLRELADDGAPIYVTVDGVDAGILALGQTVELHVNAGKHKIGGYARSMVGRVTIPAVEVTTTTKYEQHINYSVTDTTPSFKVRPATKVIFDTPAPTPTPAPAPAATPAAPATPATPAATGVPAVPASIVTPAAASTTTTTPASTGSTSVTAPAASSTSSSSTATTPTDSSTTSSSTSTTTPAAASSSTTTTTPTPTSAE
ncbi:hypothetical protein LLQ46_18805 [Rouxiella badensis]|uniref:hypothetical protein n=1 Tax=Rouxiella badensis TaxID=1646377 RepID=UPI001B6DE363|nr:hypothetical protein [Rouxiella badensis]MCC3748906.1 hypothetical protein [Rouxiella badensis]